MTEKSSAASSGGTISRRTARSVAWIVTSVIVVSASATSSIVTRAEDRRPSRSAAARAVAARGPARMASSTVSCRVWIARASCCSARPERGPQQLGVVEPRRRLGDPLHELADVARAREHARQALGGRRRVAQHPQEPGRVAEALAEPAERQQTVVGIDAVGEPPDHHGHQVPLDRRLAAQPAGERGDVAEGAGGSEKPIAARRSCACSVDSARSSAGSAATADSSGR